MRIKLRYINIENNKAFDYMDFAPFHEACFDKSIVPYPGDIISSSITYKRYKIIRREYINNIAGEEQYVLIELYLQEQENNEDL